MRFLLPRQMSTSLNATTQVDIESYASYRIYTVTPSIQLGGVHAG